MKETKEEKVKIKLVLAAAIPTGKTFKSSKGYEVPELETHAPGAVLEVDTATAEMLCKPIKTYAAGWGHTETRFQHIQRAVRV